MGWFSDQIQQRIQHDDDSFSEAFTDMAEIVMGERISKAMGDDRIKARNAIEEILKYYHVKLVELPENITDLNDQMEYLMRPSGIMRRTVNLDGEWYYDAVGAMIASLKEDGSAVALIPGKFAGYTYLDARTGRRVNVTKKNAALIDTEAICFYKPLQLKKIGIKDLIIYIIQTLSPSDFITTALAALAVSLIGMLIPRINRLIYSDIITGESMQMLFALFSFMICVSLSRVMIGVTKNLVMNKLSCKMSVAVQASGMMRLLSLPADFFKNYSSGDLSSRMGYIERLCTMIVDTLLTAGLTSLFSFVYVVQMIRYGPGLVVPGLMVILLTMTASVITIFLQIRISKRQMENAAKESGITYSLISGVQKIKLAGAEKRAFAKWSAAYTDAARLKYDPPTFLKFSSVIATCISLVGSIVIYYFTITTKVPLADYYAFNSAYGMVMGAFSALIGMATVFAEIKPMLEMVRPILETVPEESGNKKVVTRLSGAIELNNISFRYTETMPLVIDNLSLKIKQGQYVAVVGSTGCGKSTLIRLMLGFEKPQKGAIYYDGKDMSELDLKSLRRNMGVVIQNGKLFQGDVFSNITISAPWLTMDAAWEAAEMAGIADDIREMPMGMFTLISEGTGGISGGQRQRLMIARAVAPKPKILILDEATSALDNLTQKTVSDSLDKLKCTRIVIAHRLSTIKQCDRIIVLDKGKIIEDGKYDELIGNKGFFAELVARQQLDGSAS